MPAVVAPWLPGCEHRQRAWEFLRPRWPYPVTEAVGTVPWCKALSVNPAIQGLSDEVIVVADADVFCDVTEAVEQVEEGAAWAIPHRAVHRLTAESTARFIAGAPFDQLPLAERPYEGMEGGGIVVARREVLLETPLDPRFVGWGQEDESWGLALRCLHGPPWRGDAPLVHLYHPPAPRLTRARGSQEGWRLRRLYWHARNDPGAMRALIEEARLDLEAHHAAVHDHPPAAV